MNKQIPCPGCGTSIHLDVQQLLAGMQFACSGCGAKVALAPVSMPTVSQAVHQIDTLRSRADARGGR